MFGIAAQTPRTFTACLDLDAFETAPEHNVNCTGDGVATVRGGDTIAHDLNPFHSRYRQGIEVYSRIEIRRPLIRMASLPLPRRNGR